MLLFFLLKVEGSYFYFLMLKVIVQSSLLVLDVESFYFYSWILKVLTFVIFML
jgi:hypothetical protein